MGIYRTFFIEEIYVSEGNSSKIFVNVDSIYRKIKALFVRNNEAFEIGSGVIFVRDEDGWVNLDTGEIINN